VTISFTALPRIPFTVNGYVDIFLAFGDDFRFGGFLGFPNIALLIGLPDEYLMLQAASEQKNAEKKVLRRKPARRGSSGDDEWLVMETGSRSGGRRIVGEMHASNCVNGEMHAEHLGPTENVVAQGVMAEEEKKVEISAPIMQPRSSLFNSVVKEKEWTMKDTSDRWNRVGSIDWHEEYSNGFLLAEYALPIDLLKNDIMKAPFQNFNYWRGDFVLRFQLNGTPMHAGRLAFFFLPGINKTEFNLFHAGKTNFITQLNHVMISASTSTVVELKVPFIHQLLMCESPDDLGVYKFNQNIGNVFAVVYNRLRIGGTGTTSVKVNVLTRIENMHFMVPRIAIQL
jgi:hypothetical protein